MIDDATQRTLREFASRCRRLPPLANRKVGLHALFAGPSGAGKRSAVEALAEKLGWLAKMLAQAEHKAVVLFFDEADALFGKRTDESGADKSSARDVAEFLLRRFGFYRSVAVVTADLSTDVASELRRRMDHVIEFRAT